MRAAFWAALLGTWILAVGGEPKVEHKPLSVGALHEFGTLVKGIYKAGDYYAAQTAEWDWMDHFGAFITQEAVVEDRLHLSAGLGGIFQFRKPESPGLFFDDHQRKGFFIGPTRAEAVYHLGDLEKPWLKLGMGMFPYKYNPEAVNLGEYLFRAGAYPAHLTTGGYLIVNGAGSQHQGFKANYSSGNFKADVLLFTEIGLAPLYDWSLAVLVDYSLGGGLVNLGAGVNFKHLLQVRPSRTARMRDYSGENRVYENSYFDYNDGTGMKTYAGYVDYYRREADFDMQYADKLEMKLGSNAADTLRAQALRAAAAPLFAKAALVDSLNLLPDTAVGKPQYKFYTAAATLLMARATVDLKKLFAGGIFGAEDLKLYGEVNLLGLKDYPIFYEKKAERIPVMVGFNFPGFKVLDLIALQVEYFNSPWMNNTFHRGDAGTSIPYLPPVNDSIISQDAYYDGSKKDNFKWSVLVKKNFLRNLTLSAQFASDHLRLTSSRFYYGPQFDHNEVTAFRNHWYWMTQLSWGI